jgi:hypothetical protein
MKSRRAEREIEAMSHTPRFGVPVNDTPRVGRGVPILVLLERHFKTALPPEMEFEPIKCRDKDLRSFNTRCVSFSAHYAAPWQIGHVKASTYPPSATVGTQVGHKK